MPPVPSTLQWPVSCKQLQPCPQSLYHRHKTMLISVVLSPTFSVYKQLSSVRPGVRAINLINLVKFTEQSKSYDSAAHHSAIGPLTPPHTAAQPPAPNAANTNEDNCFGTRKNTFSTFIANTCQVAAPTHHNPKDPSANQNSPTPQTTAQPILHCCKSSLPCTAPGTGANHPSPATTTATTTDMASMILPRSQGQSPFHGP